MEVNVKGILGLKIFFRGKAGHTHKTRGNLCTLSLASCPYLLHGWK